MQDYRSDIPESLALAAYQGVSFSPEVQASQAAPVVSKQGSAAAIEDDPPANRVRLIFAGKPAEEVRSKLKANGFRWSPTIGAWQAYRNSNSLAVARNVAGIE